jgi:hypothetical protein
MVVGRLTRLLSILIGLLHLAHKLLRIILTDIRLLSMTQVVDIKTGIGTIPIFLQIQLGLSQLKDILMVVISTLGATVIGVRTHIY